MIKAVPTNIITGFLGVGKTSSLLHLLKQKPANERWAILINEFGEIGIDGSLVNGSRNKAPNSDASGEKRVFIREVPGGCMCCAARVAHICPALRAHWHGPRGVITGRTISLQSGTHDVIA